MVGDGEGTGLGVTNGVGVGAGISDRRSVGGAAGSGLERNGVNVTLLVG